MIFSVFKKVFRSPAYVFLTLVIFAVAFVLTVLYQNHVLVLELLSGVSFFDSFKIILSLLLSFGFNLNAWSIFIMFVISILFGINISLLVYYLILQKTKISKLDFGGTTLGLIFGIIGIGCASCGSLLAVSLLSLFGASGALAYFPLHGQEFGLIGVLLLCYSIYSVCKKINSPLVC